MSIELVKKLPTPAQIKEEYPITDHIISVKKERDQLIQDVKRVKSR